MGSWEEDDFQPSGWQPDGWNVSGTSTSTSTTPATPGRASSRLPASLGKPVTTRNFSWKEMVIRQWGSQFSAPDHGIYQFSGGRSFDSTDLGQTGIYRHPRR